MAEDISYAATAAVPRVAPRRRTFLAIVLAASAMTATAEPAFLSRPAAVVTGTGIFGYPRLLSGHKAEYVRREATGMRGLSISPSIRRSAEAERRIAVVYSRAILPSEKEWTPFPCDPLRLLRVPAEEGTTLLYTDASGFSLLFSSDGDFTPLCAFAAAFVKGLKGFLPYATNSSETPFPAVVDWE